MLLIELRLSIEELNGNKLDFGGRGQPWSQRAPA
jgi:hypothetical protein